MAYLINQNKTFILLAIFVSMYICLTIYYYKNNFHFYNNVIGIDRVKPPKTLFCLILTAPKYLNTRTPVINNTWAKYCDKYVFVTAIPSNLSDPNSTYTFSNKSIELLSGNGLPLLQPADLVSESYARLTDKVHAAFKHVYKHYGDYEWYLKADDDTIVFVENLRKFLKTKNSTDLLTYGYNFRVLVEGGYHSGGAYVLGNRALNLFGNRLVTKQPYPCQNTGIEDVDVGACLRGLNVKMGQSLDHLGRERFHIFDAISCIKGRYDSWLYYYAQNNVTGGPGCCSDETISFHHMNSKQIVKINDLWLKYKRKNPKPFNFSTILYDMIA